MQRTNNVGGRQSVGAFTLVELLVVVSIISSLLFILVPSLNSIKNRAYYVRGMSQNKQIYSGLSSFTLDHSDRYPPSVATTGLGDQWNWYDPRRMVSVRARSLGMPRAMSSYLGNYLEDASLFHCPSSPDIYPNFQGIWEARENALINKAFNGNHCFYWGYEGLLDIDNDSIPDQYFKGPKSPAGGKYYSKILITDLYAFGCIVDNPPPNSYSCCEPLPKGSNSIGVNDIYSPTDYHWILRQSEDTERNRPKVKLKSLFIDGHIEQYTNQTVTPMLVIMDRRNRTPYPSNASPGKFFLPNTGL